MANFYYARWDWKPEVSTELKLEKGDIIYIINKTNEEWWKVCNLDNTIGYVPTCRIFPLLPELKEIQEHLKFNIFAQQRIKRG